MLSIVDPGHAAAQAWPAGGVLFFFVVTLHFWPIFLLATSANAVAWWWHARQKVAQNRSPDWQYGYLIVKILLVFNTPWLIFGATVELPALFPTLPALPLFIACLVAFAVSWGISFHWIYFRNGAEILAYHFDAVVPRHPLFVKFLFLSTIGGTCLILYTLAIVR